MNKKWYAALAAMLLFACMGCKAKIPEYLIVEGTTITGCTDKSKVPANLVIPKGITAIDAGAFADCTSLENVTLPDSVTAIEYSAFSSCTSLKNIDFGKGVERIEMAAFENCTSLERVTLPASLTRLTFISFSGCDNITEVQFMGTVEQWCQLDIGKLSNAECIILGDGTDLRKITALNIPEGVTAIGRSTFENCTALESVSIPASVTYIDWAFTGCKNLQKIQYNGTLAQWCQIYHAEAFSVESLRLADGTDLKKINALTVPKGVSQISGNAFASCRNLASVIISDSVSKIGSNAFSNCSSLVRMTIPSNVTQIGESAFASCHGLANVTIHDGVEEIGWNAFENCTSLESVSIPGSVTKIGKDVFKGCTSLKEVSIGCTTEQVKSRWADLYRNLSPRSGVAIHCTNGELVVN